MTLLISYCDLLLRTQSQAALGMDVARGYSVTLIFQDR
jgi:hypothetical protein